MKVALSGKVSDMFNMDVYGDDGQQLLSYDGYVPVGLKIGGGDYIELKIDVESGKIENWSDKMKEKFQKFVDDHEPGECEEDEEDEEDEE